uniref:Putative triabin-like lipocalin n=1 Tax=Panstrongylus lignarius TaxID=156445 RepID=A0A224XJY1_9HEMI
MHYSWMNLLAVNSELPNTKMNTMLLFLGLLTFALAETPPRVRECSNVSVKQNFQPQNFFKGKWFLTNVKPTPEESDATNVCQGSTSRELEDGTVNHVIFAYSDVLKPEFMLTNCTGNVKNKQEKVVFQCERKRHDKTENFQLEVTIVETDYENFAIYYVCGKHGAEVTGDDFLVLNRKEDGEPTDPRIAETLKRHGLVLNELLSRKSVHCKVPPNV